VLAVLDVWNELAFGGTIAAQFIGDENSRKPKAFYQFPQKPLGGLATKK
tara:strand:- start:43 stop:189 length:147 start_codon:yes stop_codon:yes gene_type:complete